MPAQLRRRLFLTLRRRPLLPFLLAATLAVNFVIAYLAEVGHLESVIPAAFAEVGLLGLWAGRLGRGWALRCIVALLASVGVCCLSLVENHPPFSEVLTVLLAYGVGVAAVGASTRSAGRMLQSVRHQKAADPVRYSIGGILVATTAVAVGLSLLRLADLPSDDPLELALACGSLGLLPLMSAEIVRRSPRWWIAVAGVMAASVACAAAFLGVVGKSGQDWWFVAILLQGVFYLIWLFGLRARLRKRRPNPLPREEPRAIAPEPASPDAPFEQPNTTKPLDSDA